MAANAELWLQRVKDALVDPQQFEVIANALRPILRERARRLAPQLVDDALQAAYLKVWRTLPRVDLNRPETIRALLIQVAIFGMRTEVKLFLRRHRGQILSSDYRSRFDEDQMGVGLDGCFGEEEDNQPYQFEGLLAKYLEYVRRHGTFSGAHRHMAEQEGMAIAQIIGLFHKEATAFIEKEKLGDMKVRHSDRLSQLLLMEDRLEEEYEPQEEEDRTRQILSKLLIGDMR